MESLLFLLCMHICAVGQLVGFAQGEECQRMLSSPGGGLLESGAIDVTTSEEYFIRGPCKKYGSGCCSMGDCAGEPQTLDCYCDRQCHLLGDCCPNIRGVCPPLAQDEVQFLKFITLNMTSGVELSREEDHAQAVDILGGFPFGDSNQTLVYVSSNGYFAFEEDVRNPNPSSFLTETYLVSPFWADATLPPREGAISYEIHTARNGSSELLARVSNHIREEMNDESFHGYWMMVAEWKGLRPAPGTISQTNTFQGILITNGFKSYAVFLYNCDDMGWSGDAAIGFIADGMLYYKHRHSGRFAKEVACLNSPKSIAWSTLVYQLAPLQEGTHTTDTLTLIEAGEVSLEVATMGDFVLDYFVPSEFSNTLPVNMSWGHNASHTLYFKASSQSLDNTIAPPAYIEPNIGSLEPGEMLGIDVEFICSSDGDVNSLICLTVGTQPVEHGTGTYRTYALFLPLHCEEESVEIESSQNATMVYLVAGSITAVLILLILAIGVTAACLKCKAPAHTPRPKAEGKATIACHKQASTFSVQEPHYSPCLPRRKTLTSLFSEGESPYLKELTDTKHNIPGSCIRLLTCIGKGQFGIVYRALLTGWRDEATSEIVAVKCLIGTFYSLNDMEDMLQESIKMKNFDHPNVLNMIGISLDAGESPQIVMPYMANGSLLTYLRRERPNLTVDELAPDELVRDVRRQLLSMCLQIVKGMEYLSMQHIVHRDLAARNCMIDADHVIKVGDFGLSENLYTKTYFREERKREVKLPVKWMALESLQDGIFTEKTDVVAKSGNTP